MQLVPRDYSTPSVISLQELFGTSDNVDQGFVEKHKSEHHLFGAKSLSSYLQRKLKNESLPEFDLVKEVHGSNACVVIAGIVPADVEEFGRAQHWVKLPWQSGAGSSVEGANSWRPSWYKFKDKLGRSNFVLAVWPGIDVVKHYALTVCCNCPTLVAQIHAWHYPDVERTVWQSTRLNEATANHVTGAVVVLGESGAIGKRLIENYHFQHRDLEFAWYSLSVFTTQNEQRIVLLQVKHPYWGTTAGNLAIELFRAGCMELVHCGNIGRLPHNSAQTLTMISAPLTACHVSTLSMFSLNQKFLRWLQLNPPVNIRPFRDHKHISISSPVLETKQQSSAWGDCATIDVEVYALAEAASKFSRPLSCLHYASDVVSNTQSLGEKWEDIPDSGIKEAKAAMIVCIASYLAQLGSLGSQSIPAPERLGVGEKRSRDDPAAGTRKARRDEPTEMEPIEPANLSEEQRKQFEDFNRSKWGDWQEIRGDIRNFYTHKYNFEQLRNAWVKTFWSPLDKAVSSANELLEHFDASLNQRQRYGYLLFMNSSLRPPAIVTEACKRLSGNVAQQMTSQCVIIWMLPERPNFVPSNCADVHLLEGGRILFLFKPSDVILNDYLPRHADSDAHTAVIYVGRASKSKVFAKHNACAIPSVVVCRKLSGTAELSGGEVLQNLFWEAYFCARGNDIKLLPCPKWYSIPDQGAENQEVHLTEGYDRECYPILATINAKPWIACLLSEACNFAPEKLENILKNVASRALRTAQPSEMIRIEITVHGQNENNLLNSLLRADPVVSAAIQLEQQRGSTYIILIAPLFVYWRLRCLHEGNQLSRCCLFSVQTVRWTDSQSLLQRQTLFIATAPFPSPESGLCCVCSQLLPSLGYCHACLSRMAIPDAVIPITQADTQLFSCAKSISLTESPVQLLVFNGSKMTLTEEGKKALESLANTKLAIVGIIGKFRTGKSHLLNRLLSKASSVGFRETPGRRGCTPGVQMLGKELSDGVFLLFLDTQGLADSKKDGSIDAPLFVLIARISSLLLLNMREVIDSATLDQLSCVGELARSMQLTKEKESAVTKMIWLVREAMQAEAAEDDDAYLEDVLQPVGDPKSDEIRNNIKSCFPERSCVCLGKLTDAPDEKFEALKGDILRRTPIKVIATTRDGPQIELNGRSFALLLEACIKLLNDQQHLDFGSACAGIPARICELAASSAVLYFTTEISKLKFPMATKHLNEAVASVEDKCFVNYDREAYVGGIAKDGNFRQLRHKIAERLERLIRENHDASRIQCENLLASRFDELRNLQGRLELNGPLVAIKSQDDFSKVVGFIEEFYQANAIGPAVEEVWAKHESTTLMDIHKSASWTFKFDELQLKHDAAIRESEAKMREEFAKQEIESQRKLIASADQNRRNQQKALRDRQRLVSENNALQSVIDQHVYGSYVVNRKARCGAITQSGARCLLFATSRPRGRCHHHVEQ